MRIGADFLPRLASALVMAPVAVLAVWWGGWPFTLLVAVAALTLLWEWLRMIAAKPHALLLAIGGAALLLALAMLAIRPAPVAMAIVILGAIASALAARGGRERRLWAPFGVLYAGALALPAAVLREDGELGLVAVIWLFAVVWSTDIAAYFCGRLIGGPKLWPRVSPNKTWSGAIGGTLVATLAGMATLHLAGVHTAILAAPVGLLASVASQAGDLFESSMKRHFGVKDSSHLIPGHGGFMDRLDGFVAAAALALLIGLIRNPQAPVRGFLMW
ncbi:phosphatidate cytidylyltransferase [Starkeya koreensis]|uniref:Phosphatidate cytidylyltransferase n=1 Tax=Ancylobacter koreensis TaxID=266121 RepID=A0ABT0DML3_9HYPH|nr:phosphatidate cytidylyltransferase [Ancylobacter koreensis]MCK0208429.1 phosphatidate cytidylyltransferase [Ancylobacter koreensis]